MSIVIKLPTLNTVPHEQVEQFYDLVQKHAAQLGFHHKSQLRDQLKANEKRSSVFWAFLDGELVGYTATGSRQYYAHLMRMGDVAVMDEHRRKRIGSALYAAVIATAILEGRRQLEDTIIYSLSPFMCDGFLPSLGFEPSGVLQQRTSGFRDIHLMCRDVSLHWLKSVVARLADDTTIELPEHESAKSSFITQMKAYEGHGDLVSAFEKMRVYIHKTFKMVDVAGSKDGFFA